ncbi:sugar ABC transporter permease [Agrobacterium leguminum]|uniref:carbohydrate ABC transporter permease n=1 Tax=Agrobacterium TaxID=357 RepID=UPI0015717564|nr:MULTISPECIES: sugar ABC transporter permease [Agrobacterium]MCZ7934855.1 sugar ABC transporter permease [Agrobacterium leguminum]MCZ7976990.1 sugar ABC transporter permease [Agrobacterium salinitolerans]NSX94148.1 sugar ABC transporter permease [Agrobacterium tumefaciens]NTA35492.1 sugar ABC transporter permease [Agrobacterium salinitolerans]
MTSASQIAGQTSTAPARKSDGFSTGFYKLLFMTPTIIVLALVVAGPLLYSFWLSLHEYIITYGMGDLVWFENYAVIMTREFASVSWVTMKLMVTVVVLEFLLAFGLALLLNQSWLKFREFYLMVLMLPILMTPVAVALMFRLMFNPNLGIINWLLSLVGVPGQGWFGDPNLALATVVFVDVWTETSLMLIMLYAGLKSLPQDPVEAARIDGANAFQILRHVTLPMLKPVILVTLLIRMITALKSYDLIYMLTQGGPGKVTETISFYAYRLGFRFLDIGQAAAVSFILLAAVIVLTVILLRIMREN